MSTSTRDAHLATITVKDPRWAAVVARDPEAKFYYSVRTTGVYWGVERKRALLEKEAHR